MATKDEKEKYFANFYRILGMFSTFHDKFQDYKSAGSIGSHKRCFLLSTQLLWILFLWSSLDTSKLTNKILNGYRTKSKHSDLSRALSKGISLHQDFLPLTEILVESKRDITRKQFLLQIFITDTDEGHLNLAYFTVHLLAIIY